MRAAYLSPTSSWKQGIWLDLVLGSIEMLKMEVLDILTQPAVLAECLWHQRYEDLEMLDYEMHGEPAWGRCRHAC